MDPINIETVLETIFPRGLNLDDALQLLWPVAIYVLGMGLYAIFVFKFYRFVAARDIVSLDLSKYEESRFRFVRGFLQLVLYGAKYIILFPACAFFWFAVLTLILAFLSKERPLQEVLLIALATVSAIRVTAYYNEDLSRDLAKILPFAVLAIFLIDTSFFDVQESLNILTELNDYRERILYYLIFLMAVEFTLRLLATMATFLVWDRNQILKERSARREDAEVEPTLEEPATPEDEEEVEEGDQAAPAQSST